MQYVYRAYNGIIEAHRKALRGFESLCIYELTIGDHTVYSVNNVAQVLGYRQPGSLLSLLSQAQSHNGCSSMSIRDQIVFDMDDAYSFYLLEAINSYMGEDSFEGFVSAMKRLVPDSGIVTSRCSKFMSLEGILFVLSHNTMTSDRVKKSLCGALGVDKTVVCPSRPETHFCDRLSSMLQEFGYSVQRQRQVDRYRIDMWVTDKDGKFVTAVEYDEPTHRWYDAEYEHERSAYLGRHHIRVIHADDTVKPEAVLKEILSITEAKRSIQKRG